MFGDIGIEKHRFYYSKYSIDISNEDIDKIIILTRLLWVKNFKYFIGCKDDKKVQPLCIILPKMSVYVVLMKLNIIFFIKDDQFLKKHNNIWDKVSNSIKKEFVGNQSIMKNT